MPSCELLSMFRWCSWLIDAIASECVARAHSKDLAALSSPPWLLSSAISIWCLRGKAPTIIGTISFTTGSVRREERSPRLLEARMFSGMDLTRISNSSLEYSFAFCALEAVTRTAVTTRRSSLLSAVYLGFEFGENDAIP